MWLALFLWLYIRGWRAEKRGSGILLLAGLALGFAFTTRPLSALAVAFPAGIYGLSEMGDWASVLAPGRVSPV